jgi:transcriptional regulator with XRE-family HTH domain
MSQYKVIDQIRAGIKPEDRQFVQNNMDILLQVSALLQERGWTQKELANAMRKSEPEVSKWLSGLHNLTLKSISRMEAALEADVIFTPMRAKRLLKEEQQKVFKARADLAKDSVQYETGEKVEFSSNHKYSPIAA